MNCASDSVSDEDARKDNRQGREEKRLSPRGKNERKRRGFVKSGVRCGEGAVADNREVSEPLRWMELGGVTAGMAGAVEDEKEVSESARLGVARCGLVTAGRPPIPRAGTG